MEARQVGPESRDAWNDLVEKAPHSIAWQRWEWSDLVRSHFGSEFLPLAALDGGELQGVLPLYRVAGWRGRARLISVPYAVAGGILARSDQAAAALLEEAVRISREQGNLPIALKQYKVRITGNLRTDDGYLNRELDLTRTPEELWEGLAPLNRERLAATESRPSELDYPSSSLDVYFRLLSRHQHRNGIPCVSKRWIEDLVRLGMYKAALLRVDGQAVAGALVKTFKRTVSFPFTCHLEAGQAGEDAAFRLTWELMRDCRAAGIEICHSGRLPRLGGAEPYRLGWGGVPHPYFYQYHPPSTSRTETSKRGRKRIYFQAAWRMLPHALADALGPRVARMFP